jgi:phenylpropionate dioxygenase-like ring-hydroxylating dioxygenase large terminal subunit
LYGCARLYSPIITEPHSRPPRLVPSWYLACASRALRAGRILRFELGAQPIALFRGRDTAVVHAIPGFCLHQGVDLGRGSVVGDRLRCPLHHWEYSDRCERIPGARPHYRVGERFGMIFVHVGAEEGGPVPGFSIDDRELHFRAGTPVTIDCPWYLPVVNAFDMTHLQTVHRRMLKTEPEVTTPDRMTFRVRYATRVTGDGWSDRAMRLLSGDDIRVDIRCHGGTLLTVESSVGKRRSYLMAGMRPTPTGVSLLPIFGVPRAAAGTHRLHARISAALFTAFLRRDVEVLSGIQFPVGYVDRSDALLNACYRYLCQLPEATS